MTTSVSGSKSGPFIAPIVMKDANQNERVVIDTSGRIYLSFEPGNQYFVDSGATGASDSNDGLSWATALATIDGAVNKCTANNGDVIWVASGHSETYSTTGAKIIFDVAGVTVIGLGSGSDRPTLNFGHTGATLTISAANVYIRNILFATTVDLVTTYATISGADCTLVDIETRDTTDKEVIDAFICTGSRLKVYRHFHNGYTGGDANARVFKLNGVASPLFQDCRFMTKVTTAVINFVTTACTNVIVKNCDFLVTSTTNYSKTVVDTIGGSTWMVRDCFDLAAGSFFSGGSGAALAGDDISSVTTAIAALQSDIGDPSARTNLQTLQAMLGNPDVASQSIWNALAVAGGIANYPVAAVPGNGAAIAQVLRDTWDVLRNGTGGSEPGTDRSIIDEIRDYGGEGNRVSKQITLNGGTSYAAFTVTGVVAVKVIGVINTATTNHADTSSVGTATSAAGLIAATAGTAMQTVNQIWTDNAPSKFEVFPSTRNVISESITLASTANIAAGVITLYCFWKPISSDGNVVAA